MLIVPFANITVFSFYTYSPTQIAVPEITLSNYSKLWDIYFFRLFVRTMKLGLITTGICLLLGYPLAYFLARARPHVAALGLFLLVTPLMVSAVIRVFGWIVILGREGIANKILAAVGFERTQSFLYNETAIIVGLVNVFLPFMTLPIMSAIERIAPAFEEAARNLGANWYRVFALVIVPLSLPGVISGCLLVYTVAISAYVVPSLMGGPSDRMVGSQIFDEVLVSFNWPSASALTLVLILITMLLVFVSLRLIRRSVHR